MNHSPYCSELHQFNCLGVPSPSKTINNVSNASFETQCTLLLSNSFISYTSSSTPVPVSSLLRGCRGEALGALLGNYLWVKTIIRYDTIKKAISSTTSACISLPRLRNMRIPPEQMIMLTKCSQLLFGPQNYLSSFNRTHCFLMEGNRAVWRRGIADLRLSR